MPAFLTALAAKLGAPGRMLERLIAWSAQVIADRDGTPSVKRFAYAYMVGIVGGAITGIVGVMIWAMTQLDVAQLIDGMRVLNDTLVWFGNPAVAAVLTGYLGGKAIERKAAPPTGGTDGGADQA